MKKIWYYFYNILVLPIFRIIIFLLRFFNKKVREGLKGRRRLFENLIIDAAGIDRNKKTIWFHSSSMGEFEQAKPIIEQIKRNVEVNVVVTFFSPSGYKNSLKYPYADIIAYLPLDSAMNARRFVSIVRPSAVLFMRYDFWPNFIWVLSSYKIPTFIVDATMKVKSKRKWPIVQQFHKSLFRDFTKILCVSEKDKINFKEFDIPDEMLSVVGDTRFDRVHQKSLEAKKKNLFREEITKGKKILVLGSSWESDEEVVLPAIKKLFEYLDNILVVIAPHEPTPKKLEELEFALGDISKIRFSYKNDYTNEKIIIIDSIGILLTLYYYADIAYVGGSFKQGVHNVLEPAVYGIPVVFGPKNSNSQEARKMMKLGCGIEISTKAEAYRAFKDLLSNDEKRENLGKISYDYVQNNIGATEKIIYEFGRINKKR